MTCPGVHISPNTDWHNYMEYTQLISVAAKTLQTMGCHNLKASTHYTQTVAYKLLIEDLHTLPEYIRCISTDAIKLLTKDSPICVGFIHYMPKNAY